MYTVVCSIETRAARRAGASVARTRHVGLLRTGIVVAYIIYRPLSDGLGYIKTERLVNELWVILENCD